MATFLAAGRHAVVEACDGAEGIRRFEEKQFDLVVCDLIMPEKEGIETLREIKKSDPSVKVLAVSGGGSIERRTPGATDGLLSSAQFLGADRCLAKPFTEAEFLALVDECLG